MKDSHQIKTKIQPESLLQITLITALHSENVNIFKNMGFSIIFFFCFEALFAFLLISLFFFFIIHNTNKYN